MLRVSPDGRYLWVQTAGTDQNVVLDTVTMEALVTASAGHDPEQSAFQPGGPYALIAHLQSTALVVLNSATGAPVTSLELGRNQANICYTPDGATAFVTSPDGNEVLVIDMAELAVAGTIPTGAGPMGLVLLDPCSPGG